MMKQKHNPDAIRPLAAQYAALWSGYLRRHTTVSHEYPDETPALHINAEKDGVVP